jgi:polar amino acid transport system substrate-binding protein
MWNAISAIDAGQTEAGRALGFSDRSTFFIVVLPQAARQFLPVVSGLFVSLVKDTSVVGYIAVQDLTRVGDLIRARTMEAFFPLVATALIYFVLCRLLARGLARLAKRLEPTSGSRIIKGVTL